MIYQKLQNLLLSGSATIRKYPLTLLSAFISACSLIMSIENEHNDMQHLYAKIFLTASLGIGLFFSARMLYDRLQLSHSHSSKWFSVIYISIVVILSGFYAFILPENFAYTTPKQITLILVIFFASYIFISFSPFVWKKSEGENFWEYNKNIFTNIVITGLFIGVFITGINLAITAVGALFEIKISTKAYLHFSSLSGIFGSTFIFLSFAPKGLFDLEKRQLNIPWCSSFLRSLSSSHC